MRVILAIVTSLDGRSTKGDLPPFKWSSEEDRLHLRSLIKKNNLIVFGGSTYRSYNSKIKPIKGKLRVVLTRNPKKFEKDVVPGQLEFSSESPKQLIKRLEKIGYKQMLLLSGASLNTIFFKEKLINELHLTLEPKIFGSGKGLTDEALDLSLELKSCKKLNRDGTLLLKYRVL